MVPDMTTPEGRNTARRACEAAIRLAKQRGSSTKCIQRSEEVIADAMILLAVLDELDRVETKLGVIVDERDTALAEIGALYREVNQLRGQLGWGRKYVQWDETKPGAVSP